MVLEGKNKICALEQYVIDDGTIGSCCRILKGIEVDRDPLTVDVMKSVGQEGDFMTAFHTMEHMRTEYFQENSVTDGNKHSE